MEKRLKDKMTKILFHGTLKDRADKILEEGIDFEKLNEIADFGKGFYLTDCYVLAKNTAITRYNQAVQQFGEENVSVPVVMRIKLKSNNIFAFNYNIKEFYGENIEWKKFICANRWKEVLSQNKNVNHNLDLKYDVVVGLTADGKMSTLKRILRENNYILSNDFLKKITPFITVSQKTVGKKIRKLETKAYQISLHNQKLIQSCALYKDYDIIRLEKEDGYHEQKR